MDGLRAMESIRDIIAEEVALPVRGAVAAMAEAIVARHGDGVRGVLFYGGLLRDDVGEPPEDGLLDFYVLVERYGDIYHGWLAAAANALLPPNVLFMEIPWRGRALRAKYAVISLAQFAHGASPRCLQPMIWARFCQPARLVHASDERVRAVVIAALADAVTTMVANCAAFGGGEPLWLRGFTETYRCELRPEGRNRARGLYEADAARYDRMASLAAGECNTVPWLVRRMVGKLLNGARLIKAVFTYDGALEYALWKIERHSGVRAAATPWQRRHPLLAAPGLVWRLYRLGAFKTRANQD